MCIGPLAPKAPSVPAPPPPPLPAPPIPQQVVGTQGTSSARASARRRAQLSGGPGQNRTILGGVLSGGSSGTSSLLG